MGYENGRVLERILEAAVKIEANQREQLELDRARAAQHCADTDPIVRKMIEDELRIPPLMKPGTIRSPYSLSMKQEQTEVSRTISEWAAELVRKQLEFESNLPKPPIGFAWVRHDKWPDVFDAGRDADSYSIQTEYTLEPLPGFFPTREEGAR